MAGETKSKTKAKMGRPTTFTQEIADELCARLAEGQSLRTVCADDSMPAMRTIFYWLRSNEEFLQQYMRAKDEAADALADDIQDVSDKVLKGVYEPNAARVALDGKKWVASKLKPKKYGDKLDVTSGGETVKRGMDIAEIDTILARYDEAKGNNKS